MRKIKIGILEFGAGQLNLNKILKNLFEYAIEADNLGFSKFWLGEHYLVNSIWYNPEILIPIIAGQTNRISVGSAGVLLSHHVPYDVALKYKLLSNLFPDRIDMGIAKGKAPKEISSLLNESNQEKLHDPTFIGEQIKSLISLVRSDELAENGTPFVPPFRGAIPSIWGLKSGFENLAEVSELGINCSISLFHKKFDEENLKSAGEKIKEFRAEYFNKNGLNPSINLGIAGICAKDFSSARRVLDGLKNKIGFEISNVLLGSPEYFHEKLTLYQELLGIDEFIFLNMAQHHVSKFKSIELISNKFGLT
ncbi:Flavin-dependent oxidoreductase, luciferase family (includes alkanesulfonate monooxygenase SsuD and methylene tetrahydromethanopterin reductase) [Hydrobacter penzbergensis]|uniref:Flavin-dependent oxidoreductase, luciferase family (Includes alkanesulfonate monooxygenase SsuD and methylene tetrahydromethanopterin reductase) n=1 Tax=Hydrobacter penzbergensis TaxID=1235997 RepID=A0A8X8IFU0_9BACT|nr:LLM class flavin-dependent oxidoreductase [Hydrobacter penzbergensis]SDX01133.1 Flavin-dependent oxidoreductase, luciferase family (includes alkanesulfonate monooxygenase SsuD and methylene tetrahydromethanopterin reductase) [Hydrobacter penzbergensis]